MSQVSIITVGQARDLAKLAEDEPQVVFFRGIMFVVELNESAENIARRMTEYFQTLPVEESPLPRVLPQSRRVFGQTKNSIQYCPGDIGTPGDT